MMASLNIGTFIRAFTATMSTTQHRCLCVIQSCRRKIAGVGIRGYAFSCKDQDDNDSDFEPLLKIIIKVLRILAIRSLNIPLNLYVRFVLLPLPSF